MPVFCNKMIGQKKAWRLKPRDNLTQVNVALLTLSTTARLLFGPLPYEITLIIIEVLFIASNIKELKLKLSRIAYTLFYFWTNH